jgi:hypothetical protein
MLNLVSSAQKATVLSQWTKWSQLICRPPFGRIKLALISGGRAQPLKKLMAKSHHPNPQRRNQRDHPSPCGVSHLNLCFIKALLLFLVKMDHKKLDFLDQWQAASLYKIRQDFHPLASCDILIVNTGQAMDTNHEVQALRFLLFDMTETMERDDTSS